MGSPLFLDLANECKLLLPVLFSALFVSNFPISSYRILVVFKAAAEMVASVFLGNKIKVFFLGRIESSFERFSSWAADRAGRKTPVAVCIIGRVEF